MSLTGSMFLHDLHRGRLIQDLGDGLRAAVELYYQAWCTDADEVDPEFRDAMEHIVQETELGSLLDVAALIDGVQRDITSRTGRQFKSPTAY